MGWHHGCSRRVRRILIAGMGSTLLSLPLSASAQSELFELDLEDLVELKVTSVSKREELAGEAPAAIHVITGDELRRSGAQSIPEALRGVPGLQVAQLSGNRWGVASRGFVNVFSDKLLVLIDGRSTYTPLFAGVFWDVQDTLLDDIDRIEVIRGPGGTLWGSNAVNGVINIVTKSADQTQGTFFQSGGGITEQVHVGARHGGQLGSAGHWRAYAKYLQRDELDDGKLAPANDGTEQMRGGFRTDLELSERNSLTFQGDAYAGKTYGISMAPDPATLATTQFRSDGDNYGANTLARLTHKFSEESEASLQLYLDYVDRNELLFDYRRLTNDAEFQHRFPLSENLQLTWGASYRVHRDKVKKRFHVSTFPGSRSYKLMSGFMQSELRLLDEQLRITVGTKVEKNDFSGLEHQPNLRIAYLPTPSVTLWGAVSRAVRTPARGVADSIATLSSVLPPTAPLPTEVSVVGIDTLGGEDLVAYELGVRFRPLEDVVVSLAGFYNQYDNIQTFEQGAPICTDGTPITGGPSIVACAAGGNRLRQPLFTNNRREAQSKGLEASIRYQATKDWQLDFVYSYFDVGFDLDADSTSAFSLFDENHTPENQFHLRSRMNLPNNLTLDTFVSHVGPLGALNVDSYTRLDMRLAWRMNDSVELALVGQNLIEEHEELTGQPFFFGSEIPRTVFATITWRR